MSRVNGADLLRLLPVGRHGWLVRTPGFTAREVRRLLREGAGSARGRAVSRCAAGAADWLPAGPDIVACPHHYWQHLPRILYWYCRGESADAIGRRVGAPWGAWGVERALATACRRIADCLNADPHRYGLER